MQPAVYKSRIEEEGATKRTFQLSQQAEISTWLKQTHGDSNEANQAADDEWPGRWHNFHCCAVQKLYRRGAVDYFRALKIVSGCIKRGTYETVTNPWE